MSADEFAIEAPSGAHIVIAAGGTGGHMVPAHAVAEELTARGYQISLITDERGTAYPGLFGNMPKHVIPAASPGRSGLRNAIHVVRTLFEGKAASGRLFDTYAPAAVLGFGGYPALPAVWAAIAKKIPTLIHEQNAVMGRANRLLARKVDTIATSFADTQQVPGSARDKMVLTGNPVRREIRALRDIAFPSFHGDSIFRVLVIGGSQGARVLSNVVPTAMEMLPLNLRRRLQVTQQCREEDINAVRSAYSRNGIAADLGVYIEDMGARLRWTHLVIARAGASTLSELTTAGRPAILVPLPSAMDDHQTRNCRELAAAGGARVIPEARFTPTELVKQIQKIALEPGALANAARRARSVGIGDAAERVADAAERLMGKAIPERVRLSDDLPLQKGAA